MAYEKGERVEPGIWRLKGSRAYIAEVSYPDPETGKRKRERQTFNRKELAQQWRRKMQDDDVRRQLGVGAELKPITFDEFTPEYLASWSIDRKPSTIASETNRIDGILSPEFGDLVLHTIRRKDIEEFLAQRRQTVTRATANRDLCRLKNMLRKAEEWGYIESNPAAGIKQGREQIVAQDFLSAEEVASLIQACDDRIRPLIVTAVNTGMRWGELMSLEWRDVHFDQGSIHVRDPKNSEDRHVPMNAAVRDSLEGHRRSQTAEAGRILSQVFVNPSTGKSWVDARKRFRKALDAAEIERHFPLKNLRHTAASHLVMSGVDLRTVGNILGHKTLDVTLRYAHLSPEHLQEAVARLKFEPKKKSADRENA